MAYFLICTQKMVCNNSFVMLLVEVRCRPSFQWSIHENFCPHIDWPLYFLFYNLVLSPEFHDNGHVTRTEAGNPYDSSGQLSDLHEQNRSLNERAAISDISIMYIEINDAASRKWVSLLADQRASYVDQRSCNEGKNWLLCNGKEKATVTETI